MIMFIKKIVHRRKLTFSVLLLLSLAISAWMCYAPSASAHAMSGGPATLQHTYIGHTSLHTYVLCPGNGCNHQDPYAMGCAASMYPVAIAPLDGGSVTGQVVLEYSSVCQTNWNQIYSDNGAEYLAGCVIRKAGPDGPTDADCYSSTRFSWINTNMLWSPHNLDDAVDVLWISVVAVPWDRSPDTILRLDTIRHRIAKTQRNLRLS